MPRCSRGSTRSRSSGRSSTPWSRPGRATGPRSRTTRPDPGARLPRTSSSAATGGPGGGIESSVEPGRRFQTDARAEPAHPGAGPASGASVAAALASIREIEREVAALRTAPGSDAPYQRTSVMTHTAWVPEEWAEAVEDVLSGLAAQHPVRPIVLFPRTVEEDGIESDVEVDVFNVAFNDKTYTETIRIRLK